MRRLDYEGTTGQWRETPLATFHVATTPFAQGALRAAYRAFVSVDLNDPLVAKRFLVESPDNERTYHLDVAQQMTAHAIGEAYNSYKPPKLVKMIPAFLVVVCDDEGRERTYACEKALAEGTFVKHNDNAGFVEQSGEARNTPHALSHFSWESSKKTLLIADVQGVGDSYTDPGIQSLDRRFGYTDLGPVGVAFFFRCLAFFCAFLQMSHLSLPARTSATPFASRLDCGRLIWRTARRRTRRPTFPCARERRCHR